MGVEAKRLTIVRDTSFAIANPLKAQLTDGSIVVFSSGAHVVDHRLLGEGWQFTPTIRDSVQVASVPLDSVVGVVAFRTKVDPGQSVGQSVAAIVTGLFGLIVGFYALCVATRCMR
jgi:hypothetical protein